MAIKVQGTTVIDDSRNITNVNAITASDSIVINDNTTGSLDLRRPTTNDYLGIAYRDNTTVRWLQYAANNATADLVWQSRDANGAVIGSAMILRNATRNAEFYGDVDIISGDLILNSPGQRIVLDSDAGQLAYIEAQDGSINIGSDAIIRFRETDANVDSIVFDVNTGTITASRLIGSADTLTTARTISLAGDVTGSASFNGSSNITITATVANDSHTHAFDNLTATATASNPFSTSGSYIEAGRGSGAVAFTINDGYGNANITWNHRSGIPDQTGNSARIEVNTDVTTNASMFFELASNTQVGVATGLSAVMTLTESAITAGAGVSFVGALSGNATTATTLQTARTINGTSFNGSANITTANWGTSRTLTIGNTGKSVNGSGNVSWSLSEIGALPLTGGTVSGEVIIERTNGSRALAVLDNSSSGSSPYSLFRGQRSDGNAHFEGKIALAKWRTDAAHATAGGSKLGSIWFGGNHTNGSESNIAYAAMIAGIASNNGNWSNVNTMHTDIAFFTGSTGVDISGNVSAGTERMRIDSLGKVGIGTSNPTEALHVVGNVLYTNKIISPNTQDRTKIQVWNSSTYGIGMQTSFTFGGLNNDYAMTFQMNNDNGRGFWWGDSSHANNQGAMALTTDGRLSVANALNIGFGESSTAAPGGTSIVAINRLSTDGTLVEFLQAGTIEGTISVSGTTVSYNGGHLARWTRLVDGEDSSQLMKGTVLSNRDEMVTWIDEESGLPEDNEQLNKVGISAIVGDKDVAGVYVSLDEEGDIMMAMTGDMVIRIASGVTVQRGDLLQSAGNGCAIPQEDDIIRSKTIAKVTSTHVSHEYADGSYCVPCVLMAC